MNSLEVGFPDSPNLRTSLERIRKVAAKNEEVGFVSKIRDQVLLRDIEMMERLSEDRHCRNSGMRRADTVVDEDIKSSKGEEQRVTGTPV